MGKNNNTSIVIAEDSHTQAEQLRFLLEEQGYTVFCGKDGSEALDMIKIHHPTLVISDILMPELDGYQLCRKIKKDPVLKKIPVVLLTVLSHPRDIIKGLECGADNFITKPYKNEHLLSLLHRIISNIQLRQETKTEPGLKVNFNKKTYHIDAGRVQILDTLLSSIEHSTGENEKLRQSNKHLEKTREELKRSNQNLEKEVEKRTKKIKRLNSLLTAIRKIDQLIVKEKNPGILLQTACEQLVSIRDYYYAVYLYLDKDGKILFTGYSGVEDHSEKFSDYLDKGMLPACCEKAMNRAGELTEGKIQDLVVTEDHKRECGDCPLIPEEKGLKSITIPLKHNDRYLGLLVILVPFRISSIMEEIDLLEGAANDLAFALADIELQAENKKVNRELVKMAHDLNKRVKELNCIHGIEEAMTLPGISINEIFNETIHLIRQTWQFPELTACRIEYNGETFQSENYRETERSLKTDLIVHGKKKGLLEVCYIEDINDHPGDPFVEEEMHLHRNIGRQLEKFIQRKDTEERLKEQHKLLYQLINSSPDLVSLKDRNGRYIMNNTAFNRITGLNDRETTTGETDFDLFPEEYAGRYLEEDRRVLEKGKPDLNREEMIPDRKGNERWFLTSRIPLKDESGKISGIINVSRDITERKKNLEELKQARERAVKADQLKTAFLMNMSHEVRTPMNAIIGFADLLLSPSVLKQDKDSFLEMIKENSMRLLRLLNDILDISRIETGSVEIIPKAFSLRKLVMDLHKDFNDQKIRMGKENVKISISEKCSHHDYRIITDPERLKQIISNLVENALKFTESGFIEMGYEMVQSKSPGEKQSDALKQKFLCFSIKDTGIGIDKDSLDFIFDRFSKVESKMKIYDGTGLGLAISKDLVKLLGGEIWVESEPGKGSEFFFTIPFKEARGEKEIITRSGTGMRKIDWKSKLILVAEDEESNFALLKFNLRRTGAQLLWARNGNEAVDVCRSNKAIDLVLMDIKMPGLDGLQAARLIRKNRKDLPVIAVSAFSAEEDIKSSREAGCDEFVSKPINMEELYKKMNYCLERS